MKHWPIMFYVLEKLAVYYFSDTIYRILTFIQTGPLITNFCLFKKKNQNIHS